MAAENVAATMRRIRRKRVEQEVVAPAQLAPGMKLHRALRGLMSWKALFTLDTMKTEFWYSRAIFETFTGRGGGPCAPGTHNQTNLCIARFDGLESSRQTDAATMRKKLQGDAGSFTMAGCNNFLLINKDSKNNHLNYQ